ncbi:MAG: transcriptional regulator GcvA [Pseudomonadota bacterium]
MTNSHLPSLNALRAFEAVARHQSFRRAAEELFVTPAAITHQIKQLEAVLGLALFERHNRKVTLTPAASASLPQLQQGFDSLRIAVADLLRHGKAPALTVSASPTFASRWLMPRLQGFLSQHPGIDVRLLASGNPAAESTERDIDIRFTSENLSGPLVDLLFRIEIVPMCRPEMLIGPPALRSPKDLRHATLLHGDGRDPSRVGTAWVRWLQRAGVTGIDARRGVQFEHSALALDAAADGLGITLASPILATAELASGRVVIAFPQAMPLDTAYYLVTSEQAMQRPEVAAFHRWLLNEARMQVAADSQ